jgi:hypothetical protein
MFHRSVALLLMLLVVGAPVSAKICDAVCAAAHQPSEPDHSMHQHDGALVAAQANGVLVDAETEACALQQAVVTESRPNTKTSAASLAVASTVPVSRNARTDGRALDDLHLPPPPVRTHAPLRI